MKQVTQSLKNGVIKITEAPAPKIKKGCLLIITSKTLISSGTERMLLDFGKSGLIGKAIQQPEKVRQALEKTKSEGLLSTVGKIHNKLDKPIPLGYCNVGIVQEIGDGVVGFAVGDRVVSNGPHAEVVCVPANMCARVPKNVPDDQAVFAVAGAIALQGVRLLKPTLGETFVVTGLGLLGLLSVQLLRAHGCRVLGLDFDKSRVRQASKFGAEIVDLSSSTDPLKIAQKISKGRGVDGVLIAASTESDMPIKQAARMCRKRGKIVLVGVAGLSLSRADFYEKELSFQVSCSYGPGRYDPVYEEQGVDYPVSFVRWTAQRNFEAFLDMLADHYVNCSDLVSQTFDIEEAEKAYHLLNNSSMPLGILFNYPSAETSKSLQSVIISERAEKSRKENTRVSFIGAGDYATSVLIPCFKKAGVSLIDIAGTSGYSLVHSGDKYNFVRATTDTNSILENQHANTIVIATRHDTHATFAAKALDAGKHVFVEKPLCLTMSELETVKSAYSSAIRKYSNPPILMVGFNRRFAPHITKMRELLSNEATPMNLIYTVNAGTLPEGHWAADPLIGGGRVIGEACHFVDLMRFLVGTSITNCERCLLPNGVDAPAIINISFSDGSVGTIHYLVNGNRFYPKERLEIFINGKILQLDNFQRLRGYGWKKFNKMNLWAQNKGQKDCVASFIHAIETGGECPISATEIFEVAESTIRVSK